MTKKRYKIDEKHYLLNIMGGGERECVTYITLVYNILLLSMH